MQHIIDLYEQSVLRAEPAKTGLKFQAEDRKALVEQLEELKGFNYKDVAHAIARREWDGTGVYNNIYARHVGRLSYFMSQYGTLRKELDLPEEVEVELPEVVISAPINNTVQGLVDTLIETCVKHGITSTHALTPYINRSIEKRKAAQRIDTTAERLIEELRGNGLTREQMLSAIAAATAAL